MADHGDADASDRRFDFRSYSSAVVGLDRFVDRRKTRNRRHRAGSLSQYAAATTANRPDEALAG